MADAVDIRLATTDDTDKLTLLFEDYRSFYKQASAPILIFQASGPWHGYVSKAQAK